MGGKEGVGVGGGLKMIINSVSVIIFFVLLTNFVFVISGSMFAYAIS